MRTYALHFVYKHLVCIKHRVEPGVKWLGGGVFIEV